MTAALWCADPDEVIDYHVTRRHTRVETLREDGEEQRYRLALADLPEQVACRVLTLEAEVPAAWCRTPMAWIDGRPVAAELVRPRCLRVTVGVVDGMEVSFRGRQ